MGPPRIHPIAAPAGPSYVLGTARLALRGNGGVCVERRSIARCGGLLSGLGEKCGGQV